MTKSAKDYLESEVNRLVNDARAITRKAEDENRGLDAEERQSVEKLVDEVNGLKGRLTDIEDNEKLMEKLETGGIDHGVPTFAPRGASMGDAFVRSDGYKNLMNRSGGKGLPAGAWSSGPVEFGAQADGRRSVGRVHRGCGRRVAVAAAGRAVARAGRRQADHRVAARSGNRDAEQHRVPGGDHDHHAARRPAVQRHVVGDITTAEGANKTVVFVDFTKRSASVEKIAAFLPIADEMLEDEPQIASYINSRLTLFVRQAEEAYVFSKIYTGAMSQADASTDIGGSNLFDAVAAGILKVSTAGGLDADAVLIHPVDFWTMATTKSASSGDYFSGGPYASPARSPWGITAVITREAPQGAPVVGAFKEGATLWRKGGLTVEASNSHSDYFRKDLTALRAEERIAVTVQRPKAFAKCVI